MALERRKPEEYGAMMRVLDKREGVCCVAIEAEGEDLLE